MDQGCGEEQKVTHILVNGSLERLMDMGFMYGLMAIDMRDNSRSA